MLGFITRYGSSKGMVNMPNLSGLSREQAISLVESLGLRFSNGSLSNTTNQSLNNKVFSQSIAADTLIDYETQISFASYVYVAPAQTVTYGPCVVFQTTSISSSCSPTGCTRTRTFLDEYRQEKFVNGVFSEYIFCYSLTRTETITNSTFCCPVTASCTPSTTVLVPWGTCSGGIQSRIVRTTFSNCDYKDEKQTRCCQTSITCGPYGNWVYKSTAERCKFRTCTDTRCNTYTDSYCELTCTASCGSWYITSTCVGGRISQARNCVRSNCEKVIETRTVLC
jgi:hypothetical protein